MQDRIYQGSDQKWYYRARGNRAVGPFDSWGHADQALHKHIRSWGGAPSRTDAGWSFKWETLKLFRRSAN